MDDNILSQYLYLLVKVRTPEFLAWLPKGFGPSQYLYLLVKVRTQRLVQADPLKRVAIPIPSGEGQNA